MKTIFFKGLFICVLSVLCGCTQNNGHIGPLFGLWKLSELTVDGEVDPDYKDNVAWKFQASAIAMVRIQEHHEVFECYGTWQTTSDKLQMEFVYHDNSDPDGTWKYVPLPETHLPSGLFSLDIVSLSSRRMNLNYQAPDGVVYGYKLEKW